MMIAAIMYTFLGFVLMELTGWFIHKFVMHGPLWKIHKTHHQPKTKPFEWNDLFSLVFGGVSVLLMYLGWESRDMRFWIGLGIAIYGGCYFMLHDIIIHRRAKWLDRPKSSWVKGLLKAHQAHHAYQKTGSVAFGLFIVPKRFFKQK